MKRPRVTLGAWRKALAWAAPSRRALAWTGVLLVAAAALNTYQWHYWTLAYLRLTGRALPAPVMHRTKL